MNDLTNLSLEKAISILENNIEQFDKLANDLIEKKTIDLKYLESINVDYY